MQPALAACVAGLAGFISCTWLYGSAVGTDDSWGKYLPPGPFALMAITIAFGTAVTGFLYKRLAIRGVHEVNDGDGRLAEPDASVTRPRKAALVTLVAVSGGAGIITGLGMWALGGGGGSFGSIEVLPEAILSGVFGAVLGLLIAVPAAIVVYNIEKGRTRR